MGQLSSGRTDPPASRPAPASACKFASAKSARPLDAPLRLDRSGGGARSVVTEEGYPSKTLGNPSNLFV